MTGLQVVNYKPFVRNGQMYVKDNTYIHKHSVLGGGGKGAIIIPKNMWFNNYKEITEICCYLVLQVGAGRGVANPIP